MDRDSVYSDYTVLRKMKANEDTKIHMLQRLVSQCTNNWRVVGITKKALKTFSDSDFKPVARSGIQRAHIVDRYTTFRSLVQTEFGQDAFWSTTAANDKTILAIKGEYTKLSSSEVISFEDQGLFPDPAVHIYFASKKVGFRCRRAERDKLRKLYNEHM